MRRRYVRCLSFLLLALPRPTAVSEGIAKISIAVVIGLTPSFAVLVRAGRNALKKPDHMQQEGQGIELTTIGGSGGSGNRHKKRPLETWRIVSDSQEELATRQDAASVTTSTHHDEESLGIAR
jgi:hypothetical protein